MGRKKKQRASSKQSAATDDPVEDGDKIDVDFNYDLTKYDAANALVLPSQPKKNKDERKQSNRTAARPLSKKELKKLKKLEEKKKKKLNRANLLEELEKYKLSSEQYSAMVSASKLQTKGHKRGYDVANEILDTIPQVANEGPAKKRLKKTLPKKDLNVVEYESPESEDDSEIDEDEDESEVNQAESNDVQSEDDTVTETNPIKSPIIDEHKPSAIAEPTKSRVDSKPAVNLVLDRKPEVIAQREKLPIIGEEHAIIDAIRYNDVVIICGSTGSGKTTQVPQFLYEAGYAVDHLVGITEPKRVAAVSMSQRVAEEMNLEKVVSYHIRYDNNINDKTKVKFMTDGVLLREIRKDFLLQAYSVIIIDEAHERSVFSDVLIGLLSRIIPLRSKKGNPLKLIIMSATLRVDDFVGNRNLFKTEPPVIKIDSRQFPVSIHFSKVTPEDYMKAAFDKVSKIHQSQPDGAILVFVTGKQEVNSLCQKLRRTFPQVKGKPQKQSNQNDTPTESEKVKDKNEEHSSEKKKPKVLGDILPSINLDDYNDEDEDEIPFHDIDDEEFDNLAASDLSEDDNDSDADVRSFSTRQPLFCLPLYSSLSKDRQAAIFKKPPEGSRLCVIATNVAETSLTIPNVKYVIDTGKVKNKLYDKRTGISTFMIEWCSKASADQRAGRAGRTSAGHCYRLYSSAVFNDQFKQFAEPEITCRPIDDIFLQMKSLDVDNVVNFPFPTSPSHETLVASENRLVHMDALEPLSRLTLPGQKRKVYRLTALGKLMSKFPVSPRYARMLAFTYKELLPYVAAIISGFTVQELMLTSSNSEATSKSWTKLRQKWSGTGNERKLGDAMLILKAIGATEFAGYSQAFCEKNGLRHKAIVEAHKLKQQLTKEIRTVVKGLAVAGPMEPPSDLQAMHLRQVMLAGFFDHVARILPSDETKKSKKTAYQSIEVSDPVFIDPCSILKDGKPQYVVYQEIHETSAMFMRNVIEIEPEWLGIYAAKQCVFSKPLEDPAPFYDEADDTVKCYRTATFGPYGWPIPASAQSYPDGIDSYKWFGCFLLQGHVHPYFKEYANKLLSPATVLIKAWSKLHSRTTSFTNALALKEVRSLKSLLKTWTKEPNFLLPETLEWIPEQLHSRVRQNWPGNNDHDS